MTDAQAPPPPCPETDELWGSCGEPAGHLAAGRPHRAHGITWEPLPGMPPLPADEPNNISHPA